MYPAAFDSIGVAEGWAPRSNEAPHRVPAVDRGGVALPVVAALLGLCAWRLAGAGIRRFLDRPALRALLLDARWRGPCSRLWRGSAMIERWMDWDAPEPAADPGPARGRLRDRGRRPGPPELPGWAASRRVAPTWRGMRRSALPERRARRRRAEAWRVAGLGDGDLLLPRSAAAAGEPRSGEKLRTAAGVALRGADRRVPARPRLVTPAFEGGHIHHDMVAALVDSAW
jgi:hypothetical protein